MVIRLNAEKRSRIMTLIRRFLTDKDSQERYCNAILALKEIVIENILKEFPQDEMEILDKYEQAEFGWTSYVRFQIKKDKTNWHDYWYEDSSSIIDVPLFLPKGKTLIIPGEPYRQLLEEYSAAKSLYNQTVRNLEWKYEKFVNSAYSIEAVINIIPWLQDYYGHIAKESSCKVSEDMVKDILAVEAKRQAV